MKSKWFDLKNNAISLRKRGLSIRHIEKKYSIPRSTLSGWFSGIKLTANQEIKLEENKRLALIEARKKAILWHNAEKQKRIIKAELDAINILNSINYNNKKIIELALAMLYLGEGFKKSNNTGIGNSDPQILNFFISAIEKCFGFDRKGFRCELHLRADQDVDHVRKYWSKELKIPLENFTSISIDNRTKGKKTYDYYKGVCVLRLGRTDIQRRLVFLSRKFCDIIINK
ncbi:MAG: hypothetical protein WC631_01745 [Candidatus Paceibacterota bacterium]|jgi:hypothetical protein